MISKMSESFSDTDNRDVTEIDEEINLGRIPCYQKWLLKGFINRKSDIVTTISFQIPLRSPGLSTEFPLRLKFGSASPRAWSMTWIRFETE